MPDDFWSKIQRIRATHPQWKDLLSGLEDAIREIPSPNALDPTVLARISRLKLGQVIALLQVLAERTAGRFEARVLDHDGNVIKRFDSVADVPDRVTDDFGRELDVSPEDIELVFKTVER